VDTFKTCGDFGGKTAKGEPCQNKAGAGTDSDLGRCYWHQNQEQPKKKEPKNTENRHELWECPAEYAEVKELRILWDLIRKFCENHGLTSVDYWILANNVMENYTIKRRCFNTLIEEGLTVGDPDHGDRSVKKHPASLNYFKALRAVQSNLKDIVKNAEKDGTNKEELEADPMFRFFNRD